LAVCVFGLGAYVIGINKVVRQIRAKQNANIIVETLRKELQEPGGCHAFFGSDFQLEKSASDVFRDSNGLVNREGGQDLTTPEFVTNALDAKSLLERYSLKLQNIKLYSAEGDDRKIAQVDPAQDFQIISYFSPSKESLEKELYPIVIGQVTFPKGAKEKTCYWREK